MLDQGPGHTKGAARDPVTILLKGKKQNWSQLASTAEQTVPRQKPNHVGKKGEQAVDGGQEWAWWRHKKGLYYSFHVTGSHRLNLHIGQNPQHFSKVSEDFPVPPANIPLRQRGDERRLCAQPAAHTCAEVSVLHNPLGKDSTVWSHSSHFDFPIYTFILSNSVSSTLTFASQNCINWVPAQPHQATTPWIQWLSENMLLCGSESREHCLPIWFFTLK